MKTAISLPEDLFREIDDRARQLRLSRSGLIAAAAREFLARHAPFNDATEAWNRAVARAGQPGEEPSAVAFRRRSKSVIRKSGARRRRRW